MYNKVNHISRGVSPQRVEEYKRRTAKKEGRLFLKIVVYLVFAVSLGIILYLYNMKQISIKRYGTAIDDISAIYWFKKSVDYGNPFALWNLAKMYAYGRGVLVDYHEALRLMEADAIIVMITK